MKIDLNEEIHKKYEYLMNLSQNPSKRKTEVPYAVKVLDAKLVDTWLMGKDIDEA